MTDSTDSRITANFCKSQKSDDRFVIRALYRARISRDDVMTDSWRSRERGRG